MNFLKKFWQNFPYNLDISKFKPTHRQSQTIQTNHNNSIHPFPHQHSHCSSIQINSHIYMHTRSHVITNHLSISRFSNYNRRHLAILILILEFTRNRIALTWSQVVHSNKNLTLSPKTQGLKTSWKFKVFRIKFWSVQNDQNNIHYDLIGLDFQVIA